MLVKVIWPERTHDDGGYRIYTSPKKLEFSNVPSASSGSPSSGWVVPVFEFENNTFVLLKSLAKIWNYPSPFQLIGRISKGTKTKKADFVRFSDPKLNENLLAQNLIESGDIKFKLAYVDVAWLNERVKGLQVGSDVGAAGEERENPFDLVKAYVCEKRKRKRDTENEFKITINQVFPQYGDPNGIEFSHSAFNTLTNVLKFNLYSSTPSYNKFLPQSKMNMSEMELLMKDIDHADVELNESSTVSTLPPGSSTAATGTSDLSTTASTSTSTAAATGTATTTTTSGFSGKRRKPIGRSKKYNTNIDPNSIDLSESLIPGQGFIPEFNVNHLCKVPNYYITSNHSSAINAPGGVSITNPSNTTTVASDTPVDGNSSAIGVAGTGTGGVTTTVSSVVSAIGSGTSTPGTKKAAAASSLFGNSSTIYTDTGVKLAKNVQQLLVGTNSDVDSSLSRYYYTLTYRGPGSGNYKDAALINKINKIPTTTSTSSIKVLKKPHKSLSSLSQGKLTTQQKSNNSVKGFVHDSFTKELINDTITKQSSFVADCSNLEMLHNNLQFNVLLNAYGEISEETWNNYYKFKLIDFEQLGMKQRERAQRENYISAVKAAEEVAAEAREKALEDRVKAQEIREAHEAAVQEAEENDETPPPTPEIPQSKPPAPVTLPPAPPPFKLGSRFAKPTNYLEIVKHIPVELRDEVEPAEYFDKIPAIKDVLDFRTNYPDTMNPHLLTQVEVVKIPNANSLGWDNLKKFRER